MSITLMSAAFKAQIRPVQKLVFLALCDCANDQGECYPSVPTLMEKSSASERAVQEALAFLERGGFVSREFRNGRSTVYWIADPRTWRTPAADAPPHRAHPTPAPHAPPPPHRAHPTPAPGAPITITEPSVESSVNRKTPVVPAKSGSASAQGFELFWAAYPKKRAKDDALKAFVRLAPSAELLDTMLAAVAKQREWADWRKDGGKYVPNGATWLNGKRWEDEGGGEVVPFESEKARAARESVEAMTGGLVSIRPRPAAQHQETIDVRATELRALG